METKNKKGQQVAYNRPCVDIFNVENTCVNRSKVRINKRTKHSYTDEFENVWRQYRRGGKDSAFRIWEILSLEEKEMVKIHLPFYIATTDVRFRAHFVNYLADGMYKSPIYDEIGLVCDPDGITTASDAEIQAAINLLIENGYTITKI